MNIVGCGDMFGNPTGGNPSTPSGPVFFGTMQDMSLDINQQIIKLMGQGKGADNAAQGNMDVKGKASIGRIEISTFNALMFGDAITTGTNTITSQEAGTVGSGPATYQVTGHTTFGTDLGVLNPVTLAPLTRVGSAPVAGVSYTQAAGTYTFATGDENMKYLFCYTQAASASGSTLTIAQHPIGYGPFWELYMQFPVPQGFPPTSGLHLFKCFTSAIKLPTKRDGFTICDIEFEAFPDPTNSNKWAELYQVAP